LFPLSISPPFWCSCSPSSWSCLRKIPSHSLLGYGSGVTHLLPFQTRLTGLLTFSRFGNNPCSSYPSSNPPKTSVPKGLVAGTTPRHKLNQQVMLFVPIDGTCGSVPIDLSILLCLKMSIPSPFPGKSVADVTFDPDPPPVLVSIPTSPLVPAPPGPLGVPSGVVTASTLFFFFRYFLLLKGVKVRPHLFCFLRDPVIFREMQTFLHGKLDPLSFFPWPLSL